jgi:RimJ/RimL family protein N-acetyltransferase
VDPLRAATIQGNLLQRIVRRATVCGVQLSAPMTTEQLLLRPIREDDLPAMIRLRTDPLVARYLPYSVPTPEDVDMALHAELDRAATSDDTLLWGIQRLDDPSLIGHVAIWPREADLPRAELIIQVASSRWRQGVASAACTAAISRWLSRYGGSTVYAAVHPENWPCQRLLRKLGLNCETNGGDFPGIHAATERVFWRPGEADEPGASN